MTPIENFIIELETAKEEDLEILADMAASIWHDHYTSIIGTKQIEYMLKKFYSKDALLSQITDKQEFMFIVENGVRLGFIAITTKPDKECFINKFYILTDTQSKNIGTRVMKKLTEKMHVLFGEKFSFRLTVNRQNFKAINFYFKNGFKIESVADFDIGDGYKMNDFIMVKSVYKH